MAVLGFERQDLRLLVNMFNLSLRDRFLGSALGMVWAFANPILMLGIFTFVFGFVFKAKLPGAETSLSYVIWLISGYGPWLAITDGLTSSTTAVVANRSLVKNLAFKTEILPIAGGLMGVVPLVVSLAYLAVLMAVDGTVPSWRWLYVLPVVVLQFLLVIGIGFVLSALNVFIRDVSMVLPNILLLLLFASPIFYPIEVFPTAVQAVSRFNPFFVIAEGYRQPLLYDQLPPAWTLLYLAVIAGGAFVLGLRAFRTVKGYFDARL